MKPIAIVLFVVGVGCGGGKSPSGGVDAPASSGPDAAPISAPDGTWTFVPFANTTCGDGTPAGIGINPVANATSLLVLFEGGGACWDSLTCLTLMTAANVTVPYDATSFQSDIAALGSFEVFSRDASSPFANGSRA